MYKLMLVDDEPDIRDGLMEVVPFEELGFTVVGQAENGIEALALCEALRPDVILTDIRMPLMDGLTMCREIKKRLPTVRFIILSGYDDFEYAQKAIELGGMRYLLKPISSVEFTRILESVRGTLDEEFNERRNLSQLRQHFETSLPLLREMLLSSLASGGVPLKSALQSAQRYGLKLDAERYVLALMRVALDGDAPAKTAIEDPELLSVAVQNIAQDVLCRQGRAHFFHYNDAIAVLFLLPDAGDAAFAGVLSRLEEAQKSVEHYLSAQLLVGVGAPCGQLSQLSACLKQALSALDQSSILSSDQVLCATELERGERDELVADPETLRALSNALKTCDKTGCEKTIDRLIAQLTDARPTPRMYRTYMMDVCVTVLHLARDLTLTLSDEPDEFEATLEALMRCPPPAKARALLLNYCSSLIREIGEGCVSSSRQLVNEAIEILMKTFDREDVGIESVCQMLHISTSYFSVLFKRETKKTFHQYLTDLRMDKAMNLLAGSLERTADVALAVGIPDPSYFSYAFKRHFGISPSQARKRRG